MFLMDTDVISEARKGDEANAGVREFLSSARCNNIALFLSVITTGELRQGVENIRHRGDSAQAARLERWLDRLAVDYADSILPFDQDTQTWGRLRAPHPENLLEDCSCRADPRSNCSDPQHCPPPADRGEDRKSV